MMWRDLVVFLMALCCYVFLISCSQRSRSRIENSNPDSLYYGVFKPLDGTWNGKFLVYKDRRGQIDGGAMPKPISKPIFETDNFEKVLEIDVIQTYRSTSPYYQEVNIQDVYTDSEGVKDTVNSSGYNKVENGELVCMVNKPDEQVIHDGYLLNDTTIVWHRKLTDPLKVEYFQETVSENQYKIIGWGYYGDDNIKRTPQTWFYAVYDRVKN